MIRILLAFVCVTLFFSCGQDKPTIDYKEPIDRTSVTHDRIKDTTKILVSELPVRFDSTDFLLFAVGLVDLEERGGYSKFGSGSYSDSEIAASYFDSDKLTGNFVNMVFQDKSGQQRKLTDKKVLIRRVDFLRNIFTSTKRGYLLYSVSDLDSDRDKELSHSDVEALYISRIDGSGFTKLTKELHEFYDWSLIEGDTKIYFRTLEDKNKDGEFTNKDRFHYYFLDFANDNYIVTEYNPLRIFQ